MSWRRGTGTLAGGGGPPVVQALTVRAGRMMSDSAHSTALRGLEVEIPDPGSLLDGDKLKRVIGERRRVAKMNIVDGALRV